MAFLSPDTIAEKIFHMIEKYIDSEDTNNDVVMLIKSLLNKLLIQRFQIYLKGYWTKYF